MKWILTSYLCTQVPYSRSLIRIFFDLSQNHWITRHEKDALRIFKLNRSFSAHAWPLSKVTCLVLWLKFTLGLPLTWANSTDSGETARMRRLAWIFAVRICYNSSFPMMRLICARRTKEVDNLGLLWSHMVWALFLVLCLIGLRYTDLVLGQRTIKWSAELHHAKTNLEVNSKNEGPDQSVCPRSLIRVFLVRFQNHWIQQNISREGQQPWSDCACAQDGRGLFECIFSRDPVKVLYF